MTDIFDDIEALEKIAVNLFYGWGYNVYRLENQLRADDLAVRAKVGSLLGQAREQVDKAENEWRRSRMHTPTREKPLPDPEVVQGARRLEELAREIGALEGQIRTAPAPEADRMSNRYRREGATLQALLQCDLALIGRAEALRKLVEDADGAALLERAGEIGGGCKSIARSLRERRSLLQV